MKLALGTAQFGLNYGIYNNAGQVSSKEILKIIKLSQKFGIDTLDTAMLYGDSEFVLGNSGVEYWKIVTKLPAIPNELKSCNEWVFSKVTESIEKLKVKSLYGLLLHNPNQLLSDIGESLYSAISLMKSEKITRKIGISIYNIEELDILFEKYNFDIIQAPLNIINRDLIDSGWANKLKKLGVEIHVRSVFLQGLLLMPAYARPKKFDCWAEFWNEWDNWLRSVDLTPLQACLYYLNEFDFIDRVVVGVNSAHQLSEIINQSHGRLRGIPDFKNIKDKRLINPVSWSNL